MDYGHWDISAVGPFEPGDWHGFIYEITHLPSKRSYIGKKNFVFKRGTKRKESDWRKYTSSCAPLKELIDAQPREHFQFHILLLCAGRCQLTYEEQRIQFERDVLRATLPDGTKRYFNRTINFQNFNGIEKQTEEAKRKIAEARGTGRFRRSLTPQP